MKKITLSPENFSKTNGGIFEGWGTSLCWWANRVGYSDSLAKKAAKLFFSKEGLDLNILRYNVGGGDNPDHHHIKRSDSAVPGFFDYDEKTGEKRWNPQNDHNQLNVLKEACKELGEKAVVEVFSNSPPYFMTVSGCSSGNTNPCEDNLKEECREEFASYLAEACRYIEQELQIKVSSLSPMNEPDTDYWNEFSWKQEGCHYSPGESQSKMILASRETLDKKGLSHIIISASDETSTAKAISSYKSYTPEARKAVGRVNAHSYITLKDRQLGSLCKKEGFNLWMSEVDGSGRCGAHSGEMGAGLWLSQKIISDINALSPSAWVIWLVIDYHKSKEGYAGNPDANNYDEAKGFWGLGYCDHDKGEYILGKKYCVFGQFTRYIRPKMTLLHIDRHTLGAWDKESKRLVLVSVNASQRAKKLRINLEMFSAVGEESRVIVTSQTKSLSEQEKEKLNGKELSVTAEKYSVTTYIIENCIF